MDFAKEAQGR